MEDIIKKLSASFEEHEIEWRVGSTTKDKSKGMMLAYVTNRAIMNRLDEVVGPENWKQTFRELHSGIVCTLSIRAGEDKEWITKEDGADLTKIEPTKGGLSDAMKRAAVQFGIGRYLYDAENVWVDLDEYGRAKTRPGLKIKAKPTKWTLDMALEHVTKAKDEKHLVRLWNELPENLKNDNEVTAKCAEIKKELTK